MGAILGWKRRCDLVPVSVMVGAGMTVLGFDGLILVSAGGRRGLGDLCGFDAVALIVAVIGMAILLGVGAAVSATARNRTPGCLWVGHCMRKIAPGWVCFSAT
jgi:hypothetical protein